MAYPLEQAELAFMVVCYLTERMTRWTNIIDTDYVWIEVVPRRNDECVVESLDGWMRGRMVGGWIDGWIAV